MKISLLRQLLIAFVVFLQSPLNLLAAVDISNPQHLMFVADAVDPIIDVIDLRVNEVVFRIETKHRVDDLSARPDLYQPRTAARQYVQPEDSEACEGGCVAYGAATHGTRYHRF